jgi:hypothetical protein
MDFVSGSINAIVVRPMVSLQLSKSVSLTADSFFFWRQRASDGLYSQAGVFLRTGQDTRARYIGAEQNLDLDWRMDRHTTFQFIPAYYEVGPYLRQTPPAGRNATDFSANGSEFSVMTTCCVCRCSRKLSCPHITCNLHPVRYLQDFLNSFDFDFSVHSVQQRTFSKQ